LSVTLRMGHVHTLVQASPGVYDQLGLGKEQLARLREQGVV